MYSSICVTPGQLVERVGGLFDRQLVRDAMAETGQAFVASIKVVLAWRHG
jgi:hypothetical protein